MTKIKMYLTYIIFATFPIMSIINITSTSKFNLALSDIFIIFLGLVWLIDIKNFKLKRNYPYWWYFASLITIFLISNIYNLNSEVASSGIVGIISEGIKFIISALYLFVGYNACEDKNSFKNVLSAWIFGLWIFMIYGLYAQVSILLGIKPLIFNTTLGGHSRFLGTITDSNAAALYLSISFFINIWIKNYIKLNKRIVIFLNITNTFIFICILLTMSRGGIIGFFSGLIIYILYNIKYFIKKIYLIPLLLCIGLSIFSIDTNYFKNQFTNNFISRSVDVTEKTGMFDVRFNLSLSAISMGTDNFILGVGRGNFPLNSKEYIINNNVDWDIESHYYEGMVAHNSLAGIFAELGILGLSIFISIFTILFIKLFKSKYLDKNFKVFFISLWISIFIQSLSISLENARVLWVLLGLVLIALDKNIEFKKVVNEEIYIIRENKRINFGVSFIGLLLTLILYINVAPKYIYGDINISNNEIQLPYKANIKGEYILRYYINTYKTNENEIDMSIIIEDLDTNQILNQVEYKQADGYANIYFSIDKETNLNINFKGQSNTKIKDIKIINPDKNLVVLLNNYPLLTKKTFENYSIKGKLKDFEGLYADNKQYVDMGLSNNMIELGNKVKYKGVEIIKLEDETTQFEFTFECLDKLDYDYIMWMHLGVNDINTIPYENKSGFINCDHLVEIPMTQWEIGKEYKHKYIINLSKGEYNCIFGFWLNAEGDRPVVRLYDKNNNVGINLGWFIVE